MALLPIPPSFPGMLAIVEIGWWHWLGFLACVVIFLGLDLGVFHREPHKVTFREALLWTAVWCLAALLFALALRYFRGSRESLEFLTGYVIELSLSMDNVFVIALIFGYFAIPSEQQHRVLFWGILGALIMRGAMIGAGVALITWVHWLLWVFGAFIVFTGLKMLFSESKMDPEKTRVVRWARKFYPVAPHLDGHKFLTVWQGRKALTPLALVLLLVETSDLLFAVDSIPAIFAVTTKPFIVFTSNVFAILGLRSLYFVLVGAIAYFRFLKPALSIVLVFIGVKMLLDPHDREPPLWFQVDIPISISLIVIAVIILGSLLLSVIVAQRGKKAHLTGAEKPQPNRKTKEENASTEGNKANKEKDRTDG